MLNARSIERLVTPLLQTTPSRPATSASSLKRQELFNHPNTERSNTEHSNTKHANNNALAGHLSDHGSESPESNFLFDTQLLDRVETQRSTQQNVAADRLMNALAKNGLILPLPIQIKLTLHAAGPIALATRRLAELSYSLTPKLKQMIQTLLAQQNELGHFASAPTQQKNQSTNQSANQLLDQQPDPLATAAAIAALARIQRTHRLPAELKQQIEVALERAAEALVQMQPPSLLAHPNDHSVQDRAQTTLFILYLLIDRPDIAARLDLSGLEPWMNTDHPEHIRQLQALDRPTRSLLQLVHPNTNHTAQKEAANHQANSTTQAA